MKVNFSLFFSILCLFHGTISLRSEWCLPAIWMWYRRSPRRLQYCHRITHCHGYWSREEVIVKAALIKQTRSSSHAVLFKSSPLTFSVWILATRRNIQVSWMRTEVLWKGHRHEKVIVMATTGHLLRCPYQQCRVSGARWENIQDIRHFSMAQRERRECHKRVKMRVESSGFLPQ